MTRPEEEEMLKAVAGAHARALRFADRMRGDEDGQGTVEYVGLAMAVGVLLLAVSSFVGGTDHGIGSVITSAVKSAVQRAAGGGK
jgi:Flp pilus assembly pilin Flp